MEVSFKLQSRIIGSACGPYQIPSKLHMIFTLDQLAFLRVPQGKRFTMYCSRRRWLAIQPGLRCTATGAAQLADDQNSHAHPHKCSGLP